jgi:hypothetical protein
VKQEFSEHFSEHTRGRSDGTGDEIAGFSGLARFD